jgi:uncharacterized BrkB/YihY/UPF0761 family membrane protein
MSQLKGQMTILVLMMTGITLIAFVALYPVLDQFIQEFISSTDNELLIVIAQLWPVFIFLMIFVGAWYYVIPERRPY